MNVSIKRVEPMATERPAAGRWTDAEMQRAIVAAMAGHGPEAAAQLDAETPELA